MITVLSAYDTGYSAGYAIGYLIGIVVFGLIWGFVCKAVVRGKGYPDEMNKGFWWGFFLGWIGLIVCAVKPQYNPPFQQQYNPYMQRDMYGQPYGQPYQQNPYGQPYQGYPQQGYPQQGYPQQPVSGDVTAQRIAELDSMLTAGMITQEEYNRRRADILSGR